MGERARWLVLEEKRVSLLFDKITEDLGIEHMLEFILGAVVKCWFFLNTFVIFFL